MVLRPRLIRDAWLAAFGVDPDLGQLITGEQRRVLCPFHLERNASCDVAVEKNAFICRSCGARGGVLDAIVLAGNAKTHGEAANWLENHGVTLC